jgi:hypothetical protein
LTDTIKSLDGHAQSLALALQIAWKTIGGSTWADRSDAYNRRTVQPLEYAGYEVNQLVYIKRVPRRIYKDQADKEKYKLSSKLQARYAGPYRVTKKISDVVFEAMIHGRLRRIHAINMKPSMVDLHVALSPLDPDQAEQDLLEDLQLEEHMDDILREALVEAHVDPQRPPTTAPLDGADQQPARVARQRPARRLQPIVRPHPTAPAAPVDIPVTPPEQEQRGDTE